MKYKDYYKILGVEKDAGKDEIKKAYRKLAKRYHPDANPGDKKSEERFKEVSEAYKVLVDDEKREKYDTFGSSFNFNNGHDFDPSQFGRSWKTHTYNGKNSDFSDFFNMFFGSNGIDINDIFGDFNEEGSFSNRQSKRNIRFDSQEAEGFDFNQFRQQDLKRNVETEIGISIEEAYKGGEKTVTLKMEGAQAKNYKIKIPAGLKDGERIKLKGQGVNGGDLLVRISVKNSSRFEMDGLKITRYVDILPWEAALGAKITVPVLDGSVISVKVPAGISSGEKLRIPGKGYRDSKGNTGDYYLQARIIIPRNLSEKEKKLYEELMKISNHKVRR